MRILHRLYNNVLSLHLNATLTFCSSLLPPPSLSRCLPGQRVERLPVWMLLLPAFLATDLPGTEEKSGIPRRLLRRVLVFRQIHRPDSPAGGALGVDLCFSPDYTPSSQPLLRALQRLRVDVNHTSSGLKPLPVTSQGCTGWKVSHIDARPMAKQKHFDRVS